MKRPSFQFYPPDWKGNAKLSRCSKHLKGCWIDTLCVMHDSDEYGILRWPLTEIANAVGCKVKDLRELHEKGVLKGADQGDRCQPYVFTPHHAGKAGQPVTLIPAQDGPIWFSSRLVVDEYKRINRATKGGIGESPKGGMGEQKTGSGGSPSRAGASSSSTSTSTKQQQGPENEGLSTPGNGAAAALVFPERLSTPDRDAVGRLLQGHTEAQTLLDELQGVMQTNGSKNPAGLILHMLQQIEQGKFIATHAHRVQAEREEQQVASEVEQARKQGKV